MPASGSPPVLDVRLVLPDHWWLVPLLPDEARARSVDRLVERQFAGVDHQQLLRAETRRLLLAQADRAAAAGARLLALSLFRVDGVPVPASLVVHWLELPTAHDDPDSGAGRLLVAVEDRLRPPEGTSPPPGFALDLARVPPGPVLRRVQEQPAALEGAEDLPSLVVDYWLERPDRDGLVHFAFATPMLILREAMLELFDAVVGAASWVAEGEQE